MNMTAQINATRALCLATLTLLLDEKVLTAEQVAGRLQLFLDALPSDQKAGEEGAILSEVLKNVRNANGLRPNLSVVQGNRTEKD